MPPLHTERSGSGPRLVLAHGFTQTAHSWAAFGRRLEQRHLLVAVDLPGHGGSAEVRADLPAAALLLAETAIDSGPDGEPFDLLGYSLGARVALHAALTRPPGLRRLILIGGTAGLEDAEERAARRQRDEALADGLEQTGDLTGFLARWVALPMFSDLADPGLTARRGNTAAGLASSLRLAGTGTQEPLWDRLGELPCPVLALAGAADYRFAAYAERMAAAAPAGVFSLIAGARHAAHLVQPALTVAVVEAFLR